jgi:hypothetical protein
MADVVRASMVQGEPEAGEGSLPVRRPTVTRKFVRSNVPTSSATGAIRATPAPVAPAVRAGQAVGQLATLSVIATRVFGEGERHDQVLAIARAASRDLRGAPIAVLRCSLTAAPGAPADVRYVALEARLPERSERPTTDEVLCRPVQDQTALDRRVTDIVFGDVSMVVPGSMTVSPWLYLLE